MDSRDAIWLSVLPDMSGFGNSFTQEIGKQGEKGGGVFGGKFTKAFAATAAIGGTAVVAGKQLYEIGATFDDVADTIRIGTGATGDALEGMVESAKKVGMQVPAEFDAIGTMVADVNTRLGLTGDTLEKFSAQALEAGRIMGEEIDINAMSSAFNVFQIQGEETTEAMDRLFQISQATGVGMNELATNVAANAPAVQALGFSFEETAALVGNLDKAGLNSSRMMAGLSRSLVNLAKDGEEPQEAFSRVVGEIEGFIEAGDQAAAIDLAGKVFGTRNATQFIGAIESGTLALEDLEAVAGMTGDTILDVANETNDFGEQWQIFKNKALVAIEPVASAVFDGLGSAMTWLSDVAFPAVANVWDQHVKPVFDGLRSAADVLFKGDFSGGLFGLEEDSPLVDFLFNVRDGFIEVGDAVKRVWEDTVKPAFSWLAGFIVDDLVPVVVNLWENVLAPFLNGFADLVQNAWENFVKPAFSWLQEFIMETLIPSVDALWNDSVKPAVQSIQDAIVAAVDLIMPLLSGIVDFVSTTLGPIFFWLLDNVVTPVWDMIVNAISTAWGVIKGIFDTIKAVLTGDFAGAWNGAKDTVVAVWDGIWGHISVIWNDWILPLLQGVGNQLHTWFVQPFQDAVEAVGRAWNQVKEFFREPINWVIRNVINGGVIDFINAITGALGLSSLKIGYVSTIGPPSAPRTSTPRPAHMGGGNTFQRRAKGGYTPPGWTLVGEEGPELVNFTHPNRVYTAAETRDMLAQVSPDILREDRKYSRSELGTVTDALAGDPAALALAAGTSEQDALLPMGGPLGRFGDWISDAWDGITSWTADIAGKAVNFVRGKLADGAKLVINPLQGLVRNNVSGVFGDFFVGAGDKLIDWIRGIDNETKELVEMSTVMEAINPALLAGLSSGGKVRPVNGPVTSRFGRRWGGMHAGIDWAVPVGTPVRAWRDGIVRRAGWGSLQGRTGIGMEIGHKDGFGSYYGHLSSLLKSVGQFVRAGEVIARSGNTGRSTGPHLHFEISRGGPHNVVNPERYLYDEGGWLEPGLQMVRNATGKPEAVLTAEQWQDIRAAATGRDWPEHMVLVDEDGSIMARTRLVAREEFEAGITREGVWA